MIDTPTLFVLGAGASQPYGYPTGDKLRTDIINNFASDFDNLDAGESTDNKVIFRESVGSFINNFDNSSLESIDKFLAINPQHYKDIGKIAITLSILKHENKSYFNEKISEAKEDWYKLLYNRMAENCKNPDDHKYFFNNNKVAFITFNYDRSLEYYLYNSFFHSFNQESNNIRNNIKNYVPFIIIHIYGSVGPLSLQDWYYSSPDYRRKYDYFKMVQRRSEGIRVIGDERNGESINDQIKKLFQDYKRIFFLGFGYAPENLDILDLPNNIDPQYTIYGSAKGMTEKEIITVKRNLPDSRNTQIGGGLPGKYAIIENRNCYEFLREYL